MSGLQRPAALEALNTKLFKIFQEGMQQPNFAETNNFFTKVPSTNEFNTYGWLANVTGMREWIGPRIVDGLKERSYTIYNKDYEKTLAVARNAIDDGNVADAVMAMEQLVTVTQQLPDDLLLGLLEGGQAATVGGLAYDGQFFYDTDHPTDIDLVSGTQRNYYASGLALDATNLKAAIAAMQSFKGENGKPLGVGQNGLVLLVSPSQWGTALDATEAKTVSTGGENILATKFNVKPIQWARLGSTTRWFIFDLASPGPKPFILQNRKSPVYVSKTRPEDDNVFWDKQFVWGSDARQGAGYGLWFKGFSAAT